jgi:uncharacterized protein YndB with AHSA1/START domain
MDLDPLDKDLIGHVDEEVHIDASRELVWRAIIDPIERANWWPGLELDPRAGGRFAERWTDPDGSPRVTDGVVVQVERAELLRLNWADERWRASTEVTIRLMDHETGTSARVRHVGWYALPDGERLKDEHAAGWFTHLLDLRDYVEARTTTVVITEDEPAAPDEPGDAEG